jgi:nitrogen fixation NifU-like protein
VEELSSTTEEGCDQCGEGADKSRSAAGEVPPAPDLPDLEAVFDRAIAALQFGSLEEGRARYSEQVLDHAIRPRHVGRLSHADAFADVDGLCGDRMEFYLRVVGGSIDALSFTTDGCGPTIACGSMLSTMVLGKSLQEAGTVGPAELMVALGGLPEESEHCAELAVQTLRQAIASCRAEHGSQVGRYGN